MTGVSGRVVQVGESDLHFPNLEALEARITNVTDELLAIERNTLAYDARDAEAWTLVEQRVAMLRDLLVGLDEWIKSDEEELDRQIDAARASIRGLQNNFL